MAHTPPDSIPRVPVREVLDLDVLVTDGGTQVRMEIDDDVVAEYAEALAEGVQFPPVVVFRDDGTELLVDGFHRVLAYRKAGRSDIEADVYHGTREEALWYALGANRAHGQRLKSVDKRHAVEMAYRAWPDSSQRRIAQQVGCTQPYVSRIRSQVITSCHLPSRVVGTDGRSYPAARESLESSSSPVPDLDRPAPEESSSATSGVHARSLDRGEPSAVLGSGPSIPTDPPASENDLDPDAAISDPVDAGPLSSEGVASALSDSPVLTPTAPVESDADSSDPDAAPGSILDTVGSAEPDPGVSSEEDPLGSVDGSVDSHDVDASSAPDPESHSGASAQASPDPDADPVPVSSRSARVRSNRIVSSVASDAQLLTAQSDLIDFSALDRDEIPAWVDTLEQARRDLGRFIRRLRQELGDGGS